MSEATLAEMADALGPLAIDLLGCDWGRKVSLPGDDIACWEKATRRVVLHDFDGCEIELKLCAAHFGAIEAQTDPRTGDDQA